MRSELPWEILCADDIAIIHKTEWSHGLKNSVANTEHQDCRTSVNKGNSLQTKLNGEEIKNVDHFKYIGSVIDKDGTIDSDVDLRMQAAWSSWR